MRNVGNIWVRWSLLAVFVVTLSITFLNLGQWQLDRLDQRPGKRVLGDDERQPLDEVERLALDPPHDVGRHVVCAVVAIAAGAFSMDAAHLLHGQTQHLGDAHA